MQPSPTNHPNVTTVSPWDFDPSKRYDGLVTFSSVEHSGLGRYGDALNPWGDLIAMARAWCVLKPGARAIVGEVYFQF